MEQDQLDDLMQKIDELISSGGITRRCVSLAQGTLSPDMRVNYEFGQVLGVNEFRQEQLYFLHKDYLHNRALHGYGTVSGLQVVPEAAGSADVQLTVTPGIGVDQCGRVFVVRNPQCAFLAAWFQRQQQNDAADLQPGVKRLYVVATYDECPDALVAIAGQPCSSSQQTQAPSRIRDSFQIALRWAPPPMPTWDAILCFADLMADVRIEPGLTQSQSDKDEIIELVRLLDDCAAVRARRRPVASYPTYGYGVEFDDTTRYLYLPAATAREDLDDIFRVWVTEVRPRLQPDVIECGFGADLAATGVLLAAISVRLAYNDGVPVVSLLDDGNGSDDSGRPYLLSTQVIQEMLALGGTGDTALPQHAFASLTVRDAQSLLLWVHHPELLLLAGELGTSVALFDDNAALTGNIEPVPDAANLFVLRVNEPIAAGARVTLRMHLNAVRVGNATAADDQGLGLVARPGSDPPSTVAGLTPAARNALRALAETRTIAGSTPLLASIDLFGYDYSGREGDILTVHTIADSLPEVREFVTITTVVADSEPPRRELRLWFHADAPLTIPPAAVEVTRIRGSTTTTVPVELASLNAPTNVWSLRPRRAELQDGDQLLLRFAADQIELRGGQSLTAAMRSAQFAYLGYDGIQQITAAHVVAIPAAPGEGISEEQVREIIRELRTLPLLTVTPLGWVEASALFELWFHPSQIASSGVAGMTDVNFRVYMENPRSGTVVETPINQLDQVGGYHFRTEVDLRPLFETGIEAPLYARFVFPLDRGNTITIGNRRFATLRDYMTELNIKLDGYSLTDVAGEQERQEVVVVYVRLHPLLEEPRG